MLSTSRSEMKMSSVRAGSGSSERRRHARYSFTGTLEAVEPDSDTRLQGRTTDLSEGGCYVDTLSPFPAGTCVKACLSKEGRSFESQARVVYSVVGMGMGLRFEAMEPQQFGVLKSWLAELSGESTGEKQVEETNRFDDGAGDNSSVFNELVSKLLRKGALNETATAGILQHSS